MKLWKWIKNHILPPYLYGGSDTFVFGFNIYGEHHEKKWFKYTIMPYTTFILEPIDKVYYWIKNRFFTRYHIVDTGLKPGYHDCDEVMFHACFSILGGFVEQELGAIEIGDIYLTDLDKIDDNDFENNYRGYNINSRSDKIAIDLWIWYKYILPKLIEDEDEDWAGFARCHGHDYIENLKTQKLDELMKIRRHLWT